MSFRRKYRLRDRPFFSYTNPEGWTGTTEDKARDWVYLNDQCKQILEFLWGLERRLTDMIKDPQTPEAVRAFLENILMEKDVVEEPKKT
jgi:hypothetical protein